MKAVVLEDWNGFFRGAPDLESLRGQLDIDVQTDHPASQQALIDRLQGADIVVLNRERTTFGADVINALPALKLIVQTGGIGRNVDVNAATARGIGVASAPGLPNSIEGVVELAIGMMIGLARRITEFDRDMRTGRWDVPPTAMLNGGTMGIVGLGRLGKGIARVGQALQMQVLAASYTLTRERAEAAGAEFVSLDALFSRSDAVFICPRLTEQTRGLVTRDLLWRMKPTAYLINVARGPIVDEQALLEALQQNRIAGAGLDVFGEEPLPAGHPITLLDNVILTPHIGWVSEANTKRFVQKVADCISRFLDGERGMLTNREALEAHQAR